MGEVGTERDRVSIESSLHDIYEQLTEGSDIVDAPFKTMKDVFMWAVCLGARIGTRKPLATKKQQIFHWAQFDSQIDVPLLKAIAIADTSDVNVLMKRNEILTIAEEYANAGIHDLYDNIVSEQGRPLWNIVAMLNNYIY